MFASLTTPVAPSAGVTETMVGAVVSTVAPGLTLIVAVTDAAPLELAVSVTAVALETVAGGEYVVLVPLVLERLPRSGLIAQEIADVLSVKVAVKPAEPVPAVRVALPGEIASVGVLAGVWVRQLTNPTTPIKRTRSNFKFFMGYPSVENRNDSVLLSQHKTLRPSHPLEHSDHMTPFIRVLNCPHHLAVFGLPMRCQIPKFNVALLSQHPCPFLERACTRFDGIAEDFETGAQEESFATRNYQSGFANNHDEPRDDSLVHDRGRVQH
jgi:hypothetical protein